MPERIFIIWKVFSNKSGLDKKLDINKRIKMVEVQKERF
jgi:hypothetical protein